MGGEENADDGEDATEIRVLGHKLEARSGTLRVAATCVMRGRGRGGKERVRDLRDGLRVVELDIHHLLVKTEQKAPCHTRKMLSPSPCSTASNIPFYMLAPHPRLAFASSDGATRTGWHSHHLMARLARYLHTDIDTQDFLRSSLVILVLEEGIGRGRSLGESKEGERQWWQFRPSVTRASGSCP